MNKPKRTRKEVRGAIIGMVMGDASLYRNLLRNKQPCGHYKLDIAHCIRQEHYLRHKLEIVSDIFDYDIPVTHRNNTAKKFGKTYPVVKFCTRVHPRLSFIAKRCYIDGKKRITPWVLDNLTLEGMALWYMDDGHLRVRKPYGGEVMLGTYGFPRTDVELLQKYIMDKFDVALRLGRNAKMNRKDPEYGWYLGRGISEGRHLLDQLSDFQTPDMAYKFDYSKCFSSRCPYNVRK